MFVKGFKFSASALLLACLVSSAPTRTHNNDVVRRQQKLANIQRLEAEIDSLTAAGKLRDAVRLEQTMENEILRSTLDEIFQSPATGRDEKFLKALLKTDSRVVDKIANQLSRGSDAELEGVKEALRRDKRAPQLLSGVLSSSSGSQGGTSDGSSGSSDDGGSGSLGIVTSLLGASSGKTNRLTRSINAGNAMQQISENRTGNEPITIDINEAIDIANEILDKNEKQLKDEKNSEAGRIVTSNSSVMQKQSESSLLSPGTTGLIGGVVQKQQATGLIGGTVIADSENKKPMDGALTPGSTGLIGGVVQKQPVTGLIGGAVIADSNNPKVMDATIPNGSTGLIGGVSFTENPDKDVGYVYNKPSSPNTNLKPPELNNSFLGINPELNSGVITGVIRPVKQTEENGSESDAGHGGGGSAAILGLIAPLSGASSGGGGDDGGGGSDLFGALAGLLGPLSSSSSGGGDAEGGGSDIFSALAGLIGPLSSSSSGGGEDAEGGSDLFGALAGLSGPLSSSSSGGGGTDGQGGSGGGLISGLLGSSSGGSGGDDSSDGGGGSNVGSLLSGVLGSSSGGGGTLDLTGGTGGDSSDEDNDDEEPAGTGSNAVNLISGLIGSSSGGGDGDGGGSNVIGLITSLLGASSSNDGGSGFSSGGGGDGSSSDSSGGSGGIFTSLLGASSGGGDGQGTDGGGSLLGSLLGSSSGSSGGGGTNDFKGQLLSTLFRIKFAIFRSVLSLLTGFLGSSSNSG